VTARPSGSSYHHGNLRASLVEAAIELARTDGPEGIALREVARRVGVSHNAAYRHFSDRRELVAEVARHGMGELVAAMQRRLDRVTSRSPVLRARRRLAELGRGYVDFALAEPGLFRVAFAEYPTVGDPSEGDQGAEPDPFGMLTAALDDLVEVGFLAPAQRSGAEILCWSAVHGFAVLHLEGPLQGSRAAEREAALDHVLATIDRGYAATTGAVVRRGDLDAR
jgi:AcrR family transcriptional regulator